MLKNYIAAKLRNGKDFTNPNTMQNKTLSFDLYATGKNATLNG